MSITISNSFPQNLVFLNGWSFYLLMSDQWGHKRRGQGGWTEKGIGRHSDVVLLTEFFTDLCEKMKFDDVPCLWQRVWSCNSCLGKIDFNESLAWVRNAGSGSRISRKIIIKKKARETQNNPVLKNCDLCANKLGCKIPNVIGWYLALLCSEEMRV